MINAKTANNAMNAQKCEDVSLRATGNRARNHILGTYGIPDTYGIRWLYPAFSIRVIGFSFDWTTSRVITHSRTFF